MKFHPVADLFPLLQGEEFEALVADIAANGLHEPIVLHADGSILDGRNRYRACVAAEIEPQFVAYQGADPVGYAVSHNLRRFHYSESQRGMVAAKVANLGHGQKKSDTQICVSQPEAAALLNVSPRTVQSAAVVQREGAPELVQAVEQARVSVSAAAEVARLPTEEQRAILAADDHEAVLAKAREIRYERLQARREKNRDMAKASVPLPTTEQATFRVIYADPPWRYGSSGLVSRDLGMAEDHYPTMSLDDLKALEVRKLAMPDSVLFMWATSPLLPDAIDLMGAWGFTYKSSIVWDKVKPFLGSYVHISHELLLIGTRGSAVADAPYTKGSVFSEPRQKHSAKPQSFRALIDAMYTYGNRIELFARGELPEGWQGWGNEAGA